MIVLDTNVVSELMRPSPRFRMSLHGFDEQRSPGPARSAVSEAEIALRRMRSCPKAGAGTVFLTKSRECWRRCSQHVFCPFDSYAAKAYATIAAARRAAGRPISHADCQIAAIARALGASVATRDVDGFVGCGIDVINPWAGGQTRL